MVIILEKLKKKINNILNNYLNLQHYYNLIKVI